MRDCALSVFQSAVEPLLLQQGITTRDTLLQALGNESSRAAFATEHGIIRHELDSLVYQADVTRIKGIGPKYAKILVNEMGIQGVLGLRDYPMQQNRSDLDELTASVIAAKLLSWQESARDVPLIADPEGIVEWESTQERAIRKLHWHTGLIFGSIMVGVVGSLYLLGTFVLVPHLLRNLSESESMQALRACAVIFTREIGYIALSMLAPFVLVSSVAPAVVGIYSRALLRIYDRQVDNSAEFRALVRYMNVHDLDMSRRLSRVILIFALVAFCGATVLGFTTDLSATVVSNAKMLLSGEASPTPWLLSSFCFIACFSLPLYVAIYRKLLRYPGPANVLLPKYFRRESLSRVISFTLMLGSFVLLAEMTVLAGASVLNGRSAPLLDAAALEYEVALQSEYESWGYSPEEARARAESSAKDFRSLSGDVRETLVLLRGLLRVLIVMLWASYVLCSVAALLIVRAFQTTERRRVLLVTTFVAFTFVLPIVAQRLLSDLVGIPNLGWIVSGVVLLLGALVGFLF